jgi:HEAT repeat protein
MAAHTRFMWRATGLLRKEPKLAAELAKIALSAGANDKTRALVLDILASVGHGDAQAAMRTVLSSPALAKSGSRPVLLQRLSLLDAPEPATVDTLWDAYREGKQKNWGDLQYASAHALAAASGSASAQGDEHAAKQLVRRLSSEIGAAETPEAKSTMLSALANAKDPEAATVAKSYAKHESADMREAAADAVRNVGTKDANDMLIMLLADSNRQVQGAALASLAERTLNEGEWTRIAALITNGRVAVGLDGAVLNLASKYMGQFSQVTRVIAHVAAQEGASPATRARAQAMLDQLQVRG